MKHPCTCEEYQLHLPDQHLHYRIYRNPSVRTDRRLVLLHGAGVAGRDTWEMISAFLQHWNAILVPDQRGAGESCFPDRQEHPFTVQALVADLNQLVDHLGWWRFDLAGYSLGGLVSMLFKQQHGDRVDKQYLLESALLDRPAMEDTIALRLRYAEAAQSLRAQQKELGIRAFLDAIAPQRRTSEQADRMAINRLGARPLGFAYALEAVSRAVRELDREALLAAQGDVTSMIGGHSVEPMHQLHQGLADRLPNWHYFLVAGTDHSLPFQKPRQIALVMNEELLRYLSTVGR